MRQLNFLLPFPFKEIEEAGEFKEKIKMYLVKINCLLNKLQLTIPSQAPGDGGHS